MNSNTTTIRLGGGLKRIVNNHSGRDVIIAGGRGGWTMHANYNQDDARARLGVFRSVADAVRYVSAN